MVNKKSFATISIIVLAIMSTTLMVSTFLENLPVSAQTSLSDQTNNDIVLLSQRYNNEEFSDKIVGEVLNNGTSTADFVKITASFYDTNGLLVGTEMSYADPYTIEPGSKSPFEIIVSSDSIKEDGENYEFTLQWRDIDGNDKSSRVLAETSAIGSSGNNNNSDNDDSNSGNED
jgi:hypothetical protein